MYDPGSLRPGGRLETMIKDFINISQFTGAQLSGLLDRAMADKKLFRAGKLPAALERKTLAMIFEKPSLRTRVSFEVAMTQLGGHAMHLTQGDIGLGKREPVQDVARVLGGMCDGIMARTFSHKLVEDLGRHCPKPVINALTDYSHPCQALADLLTVRELLGALTGKTLAFVGDGNNVARSLAGACVRLGMHFILSSPKGYELEKAFVEPLASAGEGTYRLMADPAEAVAAADAVYTDTWVSMGQESQQQRRQADFAPYQLNAKLLARAKSGVVVLHCLPAYRGFEITEEVFEAHASSILQEAENRLHFQRSLLNILMGEGGIR
jgi:ornithine carbamoyltransferase